MDKKVLKDSSNSNDSKIENKSTGDDSTIERLIQEKKQLLQEQSFQLLYRDQKIKSLENQVSIKGIEYQRLKNDYNQLVENAKSMIDKQKYDNDDLIQRLTEFQSAFGFVSSNIKYFIEGKNLSQENKIKRQNSDIIQPLILSKKLIEELQKKWEENNKNLKELEETSQINSIKLSSQISENKLLNEHLEQANLSNKKQRNIITNLQKIIESLESQKNRTFKQTQILSGSYNLNSLPNPQLRKLLEKLILKDQQTQKIKEKLENQLYTAKEQSVSKLQSVMQRMSKLKQEKDKQIAKLKSIGGGFGRSA